MTKDEALKLWLSISIPFTGSLAASLVKFAEAITAQQHFCEKPAAPAVVPGGELNMVETHPNYVAGFKAGHAAGKLRAPAVVEWRPMRTAPTDGTAFLACMEASDIPHAMRFSKDGRLALTWDGFIVADHDWPKHWMPIPTPPEGAQR